MANNTTMVAAVYSAKDDAVADLAIVEQLHHDRMIGDYDAAVIDREGGTAHIVKRADRPRVRIIPEAFGGGALPRKELKEAAEALHDGQAELIVLGDVTLDKGLEKALTGAVKVIKRNVDADADELTSELQEAFKS